MNKKRVFLYDVIRVIAVLLTVMIHVASRYIKYSPVSSPEFLFGNIFNSISRAAVPLFVMLSGALMLDESRDIKAKTMFRYCVNIVVLLMIWSFFYMVIGSIAVPIVRGEEVTVIKVFESFIYGHYHLWYLYMIVGLYLITPILRLFVNRANKKYVLYFIVLSIAFQFALPLADYFINKAVGPYDFLTRFSDQFYMGFVGGYTTYYLLGWYVANVDIDKMKRCIIYIAGVIGVLITFIGTQVFSTDEEKVSELFYSNTSINILLYTLAVFVFLFYFYKKRDDGKDHPFIALLSKLTFGVYVIHLLVLEFVYLVLGKLGIDSVLVSMLLQWSLTVVITFAVTFVISKIPVIKKVVKC